MLVSQTYTDATPWPRIVPGTVLLATERERSVSRPAWPVSAVLSTLTSGSSGSTCGLSDFSLMVLFTWDEAEIYLLYEEVLHQPVNLYPQVCIP